MTKTLFFSLEEGQKWLLLRRPLGAPSSLRHSSLPISCLLSSSFCVPPSPSPAPDDSNPSSGRGGSKSVSMTVKEARLPSPVFPPGDSGVNSV